MFSKDTCRCEFQIDEDGRNLSNLVENTVGKGEIARYEHFFLFPQYFQNTCAGESFKLMKMAESSPIR